MSLSRKQAKLIVESFEIDQMLDFEDNFEAETIREHNPELFEAFTAIVAFANDPEPMTDDEILTQLGVDYESELASTFYECLNAEDGEHATALNKWMETSGFALRVDELISMDVDGCCVWKIQTS